MEALKILDGPANLQLDYDEEGDVLYVSIGDPRPALGVDIGEGLVLRYDQDRNELAGITVVGLRARLLRGLAEQKT